MIAKEGVSMIVSLLQNVVLMIFIVSSFYVIYQRKNERFGLIVEQDGHELLNGSQGLTTQIGRLRINDVCIDKQHIKRKQAAVSYDPKDDTVKATQQNKEISNLEYSLPKNDYQINYRLMPFYSAMSFIALQAVKLLIEYKCMETLGLYVVLIAYLTVNLYLRTDRTVIIECIFVIFLTYYIEATVYPSLHSDEITVYNCLKDAYMGVSLYCLTALLMSLFMKIDFSRRIFSLKIHDYLRIVSAIVIIFMIVLNIILLEMTNNTYNWITLGSITFQPSEIVKLALIILLVQPVDSLFYSRRNMIFTLVFPVVCFIYAFIIRDIGLLIQLGIITFVSIVIQNNDLMVSTILVLSSVFASKVVLKLSTTAFDRFNGWFAKGESLFSSLTGAGSIINEDYGYQSIHALVASFFNAGLLGNTSYDVLKGVTAANSDMVLALITQRHGFVTLVLILVLFVLLLFAIKQNMKQQNRFQQVLTCLAASSLFAAIILNTGGIFSIIPLTGVVLPAISDGISAAISYGSMFGIICASGLDKKYYQKTNDN